MTPTEADQELWDAGEISRAEAEKRGIDTRPATKTLEWWQTETACLLVCVDNLHADKRQLEIKIAELKAELEDLKAAKPAPESKSGFRCSICHEIKHAPLRPVFICDGCVDIHEVREAIPPPDDSLGMSESLLRNKQRETIQ